MNPPQSRSKQLALPIICLASKHGHLLNTITFGKAHPFQKSVNKRKEEKSQSQSTKSKVHIHDSRIQ